MTQLTVTVSTNNTGFAVVVTDHENNGSTTERQYNCKDFVPTPGYVAGAVASVVEFAIGAE